MLIKAILANSGWRSVFRIYQVDYSTPECRARERHRRVTASALFAVASKVVGLVTGLITLPLTLNYLGDERYGVWMTVSSMITMLSFADLGIGNGLVTTVSTAVAKHDHRKAAEAISGALALLLGTSVLLTGAFTALYRAIPWATVLNVQSAVASSEAGPAVAALFGCFVVGLPLGIVLRTQMGCQEGFITGLWVMLGQIASLVCVIGAISLQAGLPALIVAVSGVPLITTLVNGTVLFWKHHPELRPSWGLVSQPAVISTLSTGGWFFVLQVMAVFHYSADNIIITSLMGPSEVSRYAVGMRIATIVPAIAGMWLTPLWPAIADAAARGDWRWVRATARRSLFVSFSFTIAGAVLLIALAGPIIRVWIGSTVALTLPLLLGFGLFQIACGLNGPAAMFLNGLGIIRPQVLLAMLMTIVSLVLRIVAGSVYGVSGIIWSNATTQLLLLAGPSIWLLRRRLDSAAGPREHAGGHT